MTPPAPVPVGELAAMPRLRPEVANALHVLMAAIRDEYRTGQVQIVGPLLTFGGSPEERAYAQAVGWRAFCSQAFVDLLCHQIADELTVEQLAAEQTRREEESRP